MDIVLTNNELLYVKPVPGDGNCLFAALIHQLNNKNTDMGPEKAEIMLHRKKISEYIKQHTDEFITTITHNAHDTNMNGVENKKETMERFTESICNDGIWGGEEVIAAFANMHRKCIRVFHERGNTITFKQEFENNGTLDIVYRYPERIAINRNHYDSVREIILLENNAPNHINEIETITTNQKINSYELENTTPIYEDQMKNSPTKKVDEDKLKIATWNVRGCSNPEKRKQIGAVLHSEKIHITCLQETKMTPGLSTTTNYTWYHSGKGEETSTSRGVAILIHKSVSTRILRFKGHSENTCEGILRYQDTVFRIISTHIPGGDRAPDAFNELTKVINRTEKENIIILGDFNAHLGKKDMTEKDKQFIGPQIHHQSCNDNGRKLINILHLFKMTAKSTWSKSNSTLITWTNGTSSTQIDHILMKETEDLKLSNILAKWKEEVSTDHKLLSAQLAVKLKQQEDNTTTNNLPTNKMIWNVKRLKSKKEREEYTEQLQKALNPHPARRETNTDQENKWITSNIQQTASKTLFRSSSPLPDYVKEALDNHEKALKEKRGNPKNKQYQLQLREATATKNQALNKLNEHKCEMFFANITEYHPSERLHKTYKFLKKYKRTVEKGRKTFIPMTHWEKELNDGIGDDIPEVEETTYWPLNPPPTTDELTTYCIELKNGKAPGTDRINAELIKEGPAELGEGIEKLMSKVWITNVVPKSWTETLQVPIPKKRAPKSTDDYRRITLCNTFYKIYAKHLLQVLNNVMEEIPHYQAGFIKNRSTDDHMFTVRRIMDEKWRGGQKLYVLSLDLAKAFDSVDIAIIPIILKHSGVPGWLTNRIRTACLTEETAILWFGQKTEKKRKARGIKQGCPLSPKLFNLVLHEVLITLTETLPNFNLGLHTNMTPSILAYADDLLIMTNNEEETKCFLDELKPLLNSVKMNINYKKSSIMIRDPSGRDEEARTSTITIGEHELQRARKIRYLGTYLTEKLERPETVSERIKKAYQAARILIPFVHKYKLPPRIGKIIYQSIIVPTAIYGLSTAATTKANRNKLKHMERQLTSLLNTDPNNPRTTTETLEGRTILKTLIIRRIRYWGHIQRRTPEHLLKKALNLRTEGKMKVGRPCYTWNTSIAADIWKTGKSKEHWEEIAKDKHLLKAKTKELYNINMESDSEEFEESEAEEEMNN